MRRSTAVRLAPDAAARQGRAAKLAWDAFGSRDAAVAFLNAHHPLLDARPIDLAVASAAGLASVETLIAAHVPTASSEEPSENPDRGKASISAIPTN